MSALNDLIKKFEDAVEAVIEAKWALWDQFQKDILRATGNLENTKKEKVLQKLEEDNRKFVFNPNRHLHNPIIKSQIRPKTLEKETLSCATTDSKALVLFKKNRAQEQGPSPDHI